MQGRRHAPLLTRCIRSSLFARSLDIPDAAHGKTIGPAVVVQRVHPRRAEAQAARVDTRGVVRR